MCAEKGNILYVHRTVRTTSTYKCCIINSRIGADGRSPIMAERVNRRDKSALDQPTIDTTTTVQYDRCDELKMRQYCINVQTQVS